MKKVFAGLLFVLVSAAFSAGLYAQGSFVYVNNNPNPLVAPNTISAFQVGDNGVLSEIPGSPFKTGGSGAGDVGGFTGPVAAVGILTVGNFLYASNIRSNDISAFSIDPGTGVLTSIPGSPFPTGATGAHAISLAVTQDGQFLYAGSDFSANIRVFAIAPDGRLAPMGPLVPAEPDLGGMKVSPDGQWLAVALRGIRPHGAVAMFRIDSTTGRLSSVPGSPFLVRAAGGPDGIAAGVDINCASDTVLVGEATLGTTIVDVMRIDPTTGALAPISGSPFAPGVGAFSSNVVLLCTDDRTLYVSNFIDQFQRATVTSFSVADDESLSLVPGSPFSLGNGPRNPAGMATDQAGVFLYVADVFVSSISVLHINSGGALAEVPGSPFPTGQAGFPISLAAFPPKKCPAVTPTNGGDPAP